MLISEVLKIINESLTKAEMLQGIINNSNYVYDKLENANGTALKTAYIASKQFLKNDNAAFVEALSKANLSMKVNEDAYKDLLNYISLRSAIYGLTENNSLLLLIIAIDLEI